MFIYTSYNIKYFNTEEGNNKNKNKNKKKKLKLIPVRDIEPTLLQLFY